MQTNSAVPRFGGVCLVCTAFSGKAGDGLRHLLVSHSTDMHQREIRYVLVMDKRRGAVPSRR